MQCAFEQLRERVQAESGGQFGEVFGRAPEFGRGGAADCEESLDEFEPARFVRRGDLHFEQLRRPRHALVNQAAGFGDQHDGIAAGAEPRIGEPIVANRDTLPIHVRQALDRRIGQQQVGALNDDEEVSLEQAFPLHLRARAQTHLPEQFQGERRHLDAFAQRVVISVEQVVQVGGSLAFGEHSLDGQFV